MNGSTTSVTRVRRFRLVTLAIVACFAVPALVGVADAGAYTADKSKPVLLIHGYNATSNSTDCGSDFDVMISQMRTEGFTGPFVKVGFYSADTNCTINLHNYGTYGDSDSWKTIAKAFSKFVSTTYTSQGVAVDVVGYSMGGLIARGAVYGASTGAAGFSAPIDVEDATTLGTPHNGASLSAFCLWGQCATMKQGSTDLNWLNTNGNPQGRFGTDWTVVGSTGDGVVSVSSALYMSLPASNKTTFSGVSHTGSSNYMHTATVVTRTDTALSTIGS